ncbi:unnamed protein product [Caenorhabditis sp. 36 PRJEB53466]|nr:unnamed protein product [Caenorhabditis sp. 36 PRJEB53466]
MNRRSPKQNPSKSPSKISLESDDTTLPTIAVHYRYAQSHWSYNVSAALSRKPFTCVEWKKVGSVRARYLLVEMDVNAFLNQEDWINVKEEGRREFFERMVKGEHGLPRQFFYTNVVQRLPRRADPNNSALFYEFHGKVEEYFKLLLDCEQKGDENWATPSISNVRDMLDCGI